MNTSQQAHESQSIQVLDPRVARKIAAGEVIERPASIVRELIDNAVDAGAARVTLSIENGGLSLIRVQDDGCGMNMQDLKVCALSHATSKIRSEEDLRLCRSLGFRGEALSSVAAVARLRITSKQAEATAGEHTDGALLEADASGALELRVAPAPPGTTVEVRDVFYTQPARKRFLKNPSAESKQVKTTFIDKALPFPQLEFRYFVGDMLKLFLPRASQIERIRACYPELPESGLLEELSESRPGFTLRVVTADPGLFRRDRRLLQIFINGRRVNEYAFQQAVQYAYEPYLPGGLIPVSWVFLEVDPELVDFNVHPAKREVRLRNKKEIHEAIVGVIRSHLESNSGLPGVGLAQGAARPSFAPSSTRRAEPSSPPRHAEHFEWYRNPQSTGESSVTRDATNFTDAGGATDTGSANDADDTSPTSAHAPVEVYEPGPELARTSFEYLGAVFGVFLLVRLGETLLFLDQHAVHERLLYDELRERPRKQELLVPVEFRTEPEQRDRILARRPGFAQLGLELSEVRTDTWQISAVPAGFEDSPASLIEVLTDDYDLHERQGAEFFARRACKAAVKDGDHLDKNSAEELIRRALELKNPRCPHGRPLWFALSKADLFRAVGRTF
ncbi:MAG: DNA mismatch repair endonuclease MutL [Spirochaetaceae bacterium]|nr:MAG: DNA mismatch repair endonuclease MutL [Spirochaetaceae bacterium]